MDLYPVHRQIFPLMASLIVLRFSFEFLKTYPVNETTNPGVQKPHCVA